MTKRKHCPSDTVPAASVPSTSVQNLVLPSSASSAITPVQEARPSSMKKIVEWIADPQNSLKVNDLSRMPDTEVGDIHQEIAKFVNTHCHTRWTKKDAWINIGDIKETYNIAAELSKSISNGDMDKSKLRSRILRVCPHYDTLEKVFRRKTLKPSVMPVNLSPTSAQSQVSKIPVHAKCNENNDNDGSSESSNDDTEGEDDSEDDSSSAEDDTSESDRSSKRKKVCSKPELEESLTNTGSATIRLRESCACQMQHLVEFRKLLEVIEKKDRRLSAREKALTKREEALVEKFFEYESRHQEMLNTRQKNFEETLKGQQKEFEETMAKRKNELKAEKAKLKQEMISLKQRNMFQGWS
ncbi:MAG: hypothetical protein J3Q66DRAFT_48519 [Benniella sp.]|nr:MAG: hypothetical protein J3Q66DRAFT_48519 [Benniella sp.]